MSQVDELPVNSSRALYIPMASHSYIPPPLESPILQPQFTE